MTTKPVDAFEQKAALYLLKDEERAIIGMGDDGVRKVLGIPKSAPMGSDAAKAPDFLSVTKGGNLALSEAKGVVSEEGKIDAWKAIEQLTNAASKLKDKGLAGDISRVEIIIPRGAKKFSTSSYSVKDGYLQETIAGVTSTVSIKGLKLLFVRIVEL